MQRKLANNWIGQIWVAKPKSIRIGKSICIWFRVIVAYCLFCCWLEAYCCCWLKLYSARQGAPWGGGARRGSPSGGGRLPRGPVGGPPAEGPRGGIDWGGDKSDRLYKAPTDYTKPLNIRQSPRNIIQSPDRLYKAPTNTPKISKDHRNLQNIRQNLKILDMNPKY